MTKEKILEKALELFASKGFDATSMEDIAQAVGIKKPSLYAHFPGKEEIFLEVFKEVLNDYVTFLENLIAYAGIHSNLETSEKRPLTILGKGKKKSPVEERLFNIFKEYATYFDDKVKADFWFRTYLFPPEFVKKEIFERSVKADMDFMKKLGGIFFEGITRGEIESKNVEHLVLAYYYMLSGYTMSVAFYPEANTENYLTGPWRIFWEGIRKKS